MSRPTKANSPIEQEARIDMPQQLSIRELQAVLIKHFNLHEGLYDLAFGLTFTAGAVGPDPDSLLPGVVVGFSDFGLVKAGAGSKQAVDAAAVNPRPTKPKRIAAPK